MNIRAKARTPNEDAIALARRIPPRAWVAFALLSVFFWATFKEPIAWMIARWFAPDSYYGHGVLVPFVAAWLVWRDRRALAECASGGRGWGLAALLVGFFIFLVSGRLKIYCPGALSMILVLWGLAGFLFGRRVMARLWFPAIVLTFMVALPLETIEDLSFKLKMLVTKSAVGLTSALGIITVDDGSKIYIGDAALTVGNACSGLRSLITFVFIGVLFAYLSGLSWPRRSVLFLSAIPIAILTNILRVFALCLVANAWGEKAVQGAVHDSSGYLVFILGFALLYGMEKLMQCGTRSAECGINEFKNSGIQEFKNESNFKFQISNHKLVAVLGLFVISAAGSHFFLYPELMEQGTSRAGQLPLRLAAWSGVEMTVDDYVKTILETDDIIERNYSCAQPGTPAVQMAVAFSPSNRRVAHPPEICYVAGGWEVIDKRVTSLAGLPPMVRLLMDRSGRRDVVFYFFKSGPLLTANYYHQQLNIVVNEFVGRPSASSLIRFATTIRPGQNQSAAEDQMSAFIRLMLPEIRKTLN